MDQTQGMVVAALIDWSPSSLGIVLRTSRATGMFVRTDARRHADLVYAGVIIIALAEKIRNSLARATDVSLCLSRSWRRWGTKDGSLLAAIAARLGFGHRPDLLEMKQSNMFMFQRSTSIANFPVLASTMMTVDVGFFCFIIRANPIASRTS